jgi:hypothetical protein
VQAGNVKVVAGKGKAETSRSLGGGSRKPLAVIEGKLRIGATNEEVEIHVHLNAHEPLSTFSGANIRFRGEPNGFAYWPADIVESHGWLKAILDIGLPGWYKKVTWESAPFANQIVWLGKVGKGWKIKEAVNKRDRILNAGYVVSFTVDKNNALDDDFINHDDGRRNQISTLLGLPMMRVSTTPVPVGKTLIALTYENEQVASERLAEHEFKVQQKWKKASGFSHKPTNTW